ncbi:hypothetical protein SAMD00019534_056310, partial [Acytostelium subglobosum LB1]|uniref:hypothetical protein n=1 Tax=Acytostelium subglobosum LB1 TaxID=1410327 RepID=UPI000644C2C0
LQIIVLLIMRIKVNWKENKLVIPVGPTTDKVSRLFKDIAVRFAPYNPNDDDLIISELRTSDGYFISPHLTIADAIQDSEVLIAVDFESWKTEQYKLCKTIFETIKVHNHESEVALKVNIGTNIKNNLFISILSNSNLLRLELFDATDLSQYSTDGKHLVSHYQNDETKSYVKASFVVVGGTVIAVEVEVKTWSAPRPEIARLDITCQGKKIIKGAFTNVQQAYDNTIVPNVTLPALVSTGKVYPDYDEFDHYETHGGNGTKPEEYFNVTSTGGIRFEQIDKPYTDHDWFSNGKTNNHFYVDLQAVNTTDTRQTLTKLSGRYKNKEGQWVAVEAYSAVKKGFYNYMCRWESVNITLEARETIKFAICITIHIPKKLTERQRRTSDCLPNKLDMEVLVHDDTQRTTTLPVAYINRTPTPVLPTMKTRAKYLGESKPLVYFQTVDNFIGESRAFVQVTKTTDYGVESFNVMASFTSTTYTINSDTLNKFAWNAKKANQSKFELEFSSSNDDFSYKAYAIVDLALTKTIGFCFEMTSADGSSSTGYFALPQLKVST